MTDTQQQEALTANAALRRQREEIETLHQAAAAANVIIKAHAARIRELEAELRGRDADIAILQERIEALGREDDADKENMR